jgi:hypothetical protein
MGPRRNDSVTLARQGWRPFPEDKETRIMVLACNLVTVLAALALGVILGRIWEMRKKLWKNQFQPHEPGFSVPTAHLAQP